MTPAAPAAVTVQFVLDVICSASYVAYTRFGRAAARFRDQGGQLDVAVLPFELAPGEQEHGRPLLDELRDAFGEDAIVHARQMAADAKLDGLVLDYDRAVGSGTFEAHRLIAQAAAQGHGERMTERLFRAHFTDGLDIGDRSVLERLAEENGVSVRQDGAAELRAELDRVRALGFRSVPHTLFPGGVTLSGVRSESDYFSALEKAAQG